MENDHSQLIKLLEQLYGSYTEQNGRINFNKQHSKIAKDLGYDETAFSRILNPPIDKNPSAKNYQRLFTRIETKLENKQLKEQIQKLEEESSKQIKALQNEKKEQSIRYKGMWMLLSLLTLIAATVGYQKIMTSPSNNDTNNPITECRLTANERKAITQLYADNICYQIALEAIVFHSDLKQGVYGNDLEPYLIESAKKMPAIIEETRDVVQATNLKAENGEYLFKLFENHSINNIDENFAAMKPLVTNPLISSSRIRTTIFEKIRTIQTYNFNRIDSVVTNINLPINQ